MSQTKRTDFAFKVFTIVLLTLLPFACATILDRQAQADYQKCLAWQADGYPVKCDAEEYR